jgi:predicted dehydrogenase
MKKYKVGIAGFGIVGKRRFHYINKQTDMIVTAVCDQNITDIHIDNDGVTYFRDYLQLLQEELDILFVCLPNYLASEVTICGLKKGLHVFCEKPPGKSVSDVEEVIKVEREFPHLKLKYGFNHRYHDSIIHAINIINKGELGTLLNIRGVYGKSMVVPFDSGWRCQKKYSGGGILLDQGIHMVDLINKFTDEIIDIKSFISNSFWNHDVEDNAYALLKDKKGRVVFLHSSATQWQHRFRMDLSLSEGFIELHGILSGSKSYGEEKIIIGKKDSSKINGQMETTTVKYLEDNSWEREIIEFIDSIKNNKPITIGTSIEALESMKLVFKIYEMDSEWK